MYNTSHMTPVDSPSQSLELLDRFLIQIDSLEKNDRSPSSDQSPPSRKASETPSSDQSPPSRKASETPSSDKSQPSRKASEAIPTAAPVALPQRGQNSSGISKQEDPILEQRSNVLGFVYIIELLFVLLIIFFGIKLIKKARRRAAFRRNRWTPVPIDQE
jgi:hypothetical protein